MNRKIMMTAAVICFVSSVLVSCNSRHTATRPDLTRPGVLSVYPANNATAVAIATKVSVSFSEAMDPASINASSFYLISNSTTTITGTITYDAATASAIFTPDAPLKYNTPHIAVVTLDARDSAGNALTTFTQWSFMTIPSPGSLDVSFGTSGMVRRGLGLSDDTAFAMALQKDGKIVTAGLSSEASLVTTPNSTTYFTIARFLSNGAIDTTFNPPTTTGKNDYFQGRAFAVALQADDKIVAAGWSGYKLTVPSDFLIVRLNSDGTRDTAFGLKSDGSVTVDMGSTQDHARAIAIQADGMIVVAGDASDNNGSNQRSVITRLTASGAVDGTFGTSGKIVTTTLATSSTVTSMSAYLVKIQPDNRILVGGTYRENSGLVSAYLMRYDAFGQIDNSFGTTGVVTITTGTATNIAGLDVLADGKIIIAGTAANTSDDVFVMKLNSDGTSETSFGTNGITITDDADHGVETVTGLAIQTDGKILVSTIYHPTTGTGMSNLDFALFRFAADGKIDTTFGTGGTGMVITDFGSTEYSAGAGLQQDGKILLFGYGWNGSNYDVGLARYWP